MGDSLYEALEALRAYMDSGNGLRSIAYGLLSLVLPVLGTLVHEAGHALAARRFGVPVRAIFVAPEGPALSVRWNALFIRIGLGLGRELRSVDPEGWVLLGRTDVDAREAIAILRAGPLAEGTLGTLTLAMAAVPQPLIGHVLLAGWGLLMITSCFSNLHAGRHPTATGRRSGASANRTATLRRPR